MAINIRVADLDEHVFSRVSFRVAIEGDRESALADCAVPGVSPRAVRGFPIKGNQPVYHKPQNGFPLVVPPDVGEVVGSSDS